MEVPTLRLFIYAKDIMTLMGCGERSARKVISRLRVQYRKEKHQPVTLPEFCAYMGIPESEVQKRLQ